MGWSCMAKAGNRLRAIQEWCSWNGGDSSQNSWRDPKTGVRHFFEVGREQDDGAITGTIYKHATEFPGDTYKRAGSFRIEPDGRTFRGPAALKSIPFYELVIDRDPPHVWLPDVDGRPDERNLREHVRSYVASYEKGGVNEHVSRALGHVPYPSRARIIDVISGETVVEWKAAAFQVYA